jgi:hypothetical protein
VYAPLRLVNSAPGHLLVRQRGLHQRPCHESQRPGVLCGLSFHRQGVGDQLLDGIARFPSGHQVYVRIGAGKYAVMVSPLLLLWPLLLKTRSCPSVCASPFC